MRRPTPILPSTNRGSCPGSTQRSTPAPETPWWHIVDRLIERGRPDLARLAQRHAVPVLADLALAANAPAVRERHLDVAIAGGQNVLQALVRVLGAAVRDYAALSGRTVLDLAGARVAVLDLAEVADPLRPRRTAIFYLAARQLLAGDWFLTEEDVDAMPELVRPWHRDRLRRLLETEKLLQYDEFHRTGGIPELIAQVGRDAREGRKHRRRLVLASQRLEDFDVSLRELASAVWILGADSAGGRERLASDCALDADARQVLEHRLTGPGPHGAPALLVTRPGDGRTVQLVHTVLGPAELWGARNETAGRCPSRAALPQARSRRGAGRACRTLPGGHAGQDRDPRRPGGRSRRRDRRARCPCRRHRRSRGRAPRPGPARSRCPSPGPWRPGRCRRGHGPVPALAATRAGGRPARSRV